MLKAVKGATKPKVAAPKAKYIEPIIGTTYRSSSQDFCEVFDSLDRVISHGGSWATVYKALIVLHIMIREGEEDVTLKYLSHHPRMLEVADDVCRQTTGLAKYSRYLATRATQFKDTKLDYVRYRTRSGHTRLQNLAVNKGLLRECESVIVQIDALLKVHFEEQDVDNDVVLMAFRLLVHDLLSLFQCLNEGVINVLEHFFELSHYDAEQALDVYRAFTRLTAKVVQFLRVAKSLEFQTKFHVPNIKHAPTSLVSSLEMYLNDPDFEINRRQYLAEKQAHLERRNSDRGSSHVRSQSQTETRIASENITRSKTVAVNTSSRLAVPAVTQPSALNRLMGGEQQAQKAQQPIGVQQTGSVNPFLTQAQQSFTQAAQIQLEQNQAQLRLQQLQLQQAQAQVQAQVQAQAQKIQMGMYAPGQLNQTVTGLQPVLTGLQQQPIQPQQQPIQPQQQPIQPQQQPIQPQQQQPDQWAAFDFGIQPVQPQQTVSAVPSLGSISTASSGSPGTLNSLNFAQQPLSSSGSQSQSQYNPFKQASHAGATPGVTNPFAQSGENSIRPVTAQMTAQATGTNPFRYSLT